MNESTLAQAYHFYRQNLRNNALSEVDAVLAIAPANAEAHNLRGAVLEGMGRQREALAAYEEALRLHPEYPAARNNLSRLQSRVAPAAAAAFGAGEFRSVERLARFLTALAWISGLIVGCGTLFLFVQSTQYGMDFEDLLGPLVLGVVGASLVLLLAAFAQMMRLLVTVENSNRQNGELLAGLLKATRAESPPTPSDPESST